MQLLNSPFIIEGDGLQTMKLKTNLEQEKKKVAREHSVPLMGSQYSSVDGS